MKTKKIAIKFLLATSLCFSLISNAQARDGIYLGYTLGFSALKTPSSADAGATSKTSDKSPNALRFSLGYNHDIGQGLFSVGMETGWGLYGGAVYRYPDGAYNSVQTTTLEFMFFTTLHQKHWEETLKLGALRQSINIEGKDSASSDVPTPGLIGFSVARKLSKHWAITANYLHIFGKNVTQVSEYGHSHNPGMNAELIGARWQF